MKSACRTIAALAALCWAGEALPDPAAAGPVSQSADSAFAAPLNPYMTMVGFPNGEKATFFMDFDQPGMLYGPGRWVGEQKGPYIRILTRPGTPGKRCAYLFKDGRLVRSVDGNGDARHDPGPMPAVQEGPVSFFSAGNPPEKDRESGDVWAKSDRLKLGFQNPNKAGALCMEIALVGLGLVCLWRKWPVAAGLPLVLLGCGALVKTGSRGALVGFGVAAVAMLAVSLRAFACGKARLSAGKALLSAAVAAAILSGGAWFAAKSGMKDRFSSKIVNLSSQSDATRMAIWREVPKMAVDAPWGWGRGVAGNAYTHWYQRPSALRVVRTLVSSHLTFVVENGWPARLAYAFAWIAGLALLFRAAWRGRSACPFGLWLAFGTAACFNSIAETPVLWAVPVAALAALVVRPVRFTRKEAAVAASIGALAAIASAAALVAAGSCGRTPPSIRAAGDVVFVNGKDADIWVVDDGLVLGQGFTGKGIRAAYERSPGMPPIAYTGKIDAVRKDPGTLVLAGDCGKDFVERWKGGDQSLPRPAKVVFLSPTFPLESIPLDLAMKLRLRVVAGEFALACGGGRKAIPPYAEVVPGCALYIPDWTARVTSR